MSKKNQARLMETYVRQPIYIQAVRVTAENFLEIVKLCNGTVVEASDGQRRHIKVDVVRPLHDRQTMLFVGDWLVESKPGNYRCYSDHNFHGSYEVSSMDYEEMRADLEKRFQSHNGDKTNRKQRTRHTNQASKWSPELDKLLAGMSDGDVKKLLGIHSPSEIFNQTTEGPVTVVHDQYGDVSALHAAVSEMPRPDSFVAQKVQDDLKWDMPVDAAENIDSPASTD